MQQWFKKIQCQGTMNYLLHRGQDQTKLSGRPSLWVTRFRRDPLAF